MPRNVNTFSSKPVAFRHTLRVVPLQIAAVLFFAGGAGASPPPLAARVFVSNETVPPGGTVQLKFFLSQPGLIARGELAMDLDPAVFGSAISATTFSANGDAAGVAQIQGLHVDVHFAAQNGGIGRLSGVPIVVVTATVLSTAVAGHTTTVTADPSGSQWLDLLGNVYSVSVSAGTVTVGGTLSIASITPGGGLLPSGTAIAIQGTGFGSGTTAQIDGASVASVQIAGAQTMSLILGGPTELTGKRISITNPDGSETDAFAFVPPTAVSASDTPFDGTLPILPLQSYKAATVYLADFVSIRNPNAAAVQLALDKIDVIGDFGGEQSFTIPAGGSLLLPTTPDPRSGGNLVIASAPVQIVQLAFHAAGSAYQFSASAPHAAVVGPLETGARTQDGTGSVSWAWQTGNPAPTAQMINVYWPAVRPFGQPSTDYTVAVATSSGGPWLSVTPSGTVHCPAITGPPCATLQVSVNPGSLSPGNYHGTVTITPVATVIRPTVEPAVIPVALTVTATPLPQTLIYTPFLNPNGTVGQFSLPSGLFTGPVAVSIATDGGGNWLSVSLNSTTAPTSIALAANAAGLSAGTYSGNVVATGSGNTLILAVEVSVPSSVVLSANPVIGPVAFVVQAGAAVSAPQIVPVSIMNCAPTGCISVTPNDLSSVVASVQTHSGGNWLSASVSQSQGGIVVSANPAGLNAGVYLGAVSLTASGGLSAQFPVALVVQASPPPAFIAGPAFVTAFESQAGTASYQPLRDNMICVTSESVPLNFTVQVSTSDGGGWLAAGHGSSGTTPDCVPFSLGGATLGPGTYSGNIVFSSGSQSANVQATLIVAEPPNLPFLGAVASVASEMPGAIYPGEVLALHGMNLGPVTPASPAIGAQDTTVSGVKVLIGGIPASILYASQTMVGAQVPYGLTGPNATVQVQNNSGSTAAWTVPLAGQPVVRPYHRLH